jgi:CheY-like chemotaxis protein
VAAQCGTLTATSVVGEGTTFTLDLALADEPADERDATPAEPLAPRPGGDAEHTILYVEDNPSNLRLVERVLARRGGVRLPSASEGELVQELAGVPARPDPARPAPARDRRRGGPAAAPGRPAHRRRDGGDGLSRRQPVAPGAAAGGGAGRVPDQPLDVPRFLDVIDGILVAARP